MLGYSYEVLMGPGRAIVSWSTLGLGLYFILSVLQLEYVFICCLALPLSHRFCWLLFLFCQAEKFSRISAVQKYGHVES